MSQGNQGSCNHRTTIDKCITNSISIAEDTYNFIVHIIAHHQLLGYTHRIATPQNGE